jgi:hypothetical protein
MAQSWMSIAAPPYSGMKIVSRLPADSCGWSISASEK